jgi:hypothetical protein
MQTRQDFAPAQRAIALIEDYDFLRSTFQALVRASTPNCRAINAAFGPLQPAHARLQAAHHKLNATLMN